MDFFLLIRLFVVAPLSASNLCLTLRDLFVATQHSSHPHLYILQRTAAWNKILRLAV